MSEHDEKDQQPTERATDPARPAEGTVRYRHFPNGTCWPCQKAGSELGWRLRYAQNSITSADKFFLASIVEAYRELIDATQVRRNQVCRDLRVPNASLSGAEKT